MLDQWTAFLILVSCELVSNVKLTSYGSAHDKKLLIFFVLDE